MSDKPLACRGRCDLPFGKTIGFARNQRQAGGLSDNMASQ
jgi:hypothetical protein